MDPLLKMKLQNSIQDFESETTTFEKKIENGELLNVISKNKNDEKEKKEDFTNFLLNDDFDDYFVENYFSSNFTENEDKPEKKIEENDLDVKKYDFMNFKVKSINEKKTKKIPKNVQNFNNFEKKLIFLYLRKNEVNEITMERFFDLFKKKSKFKTFQELLLNFCEQKYYFCYFCYDCKIIYQSGERKKDFKCEDCQKNLNFFIKQDLKHLIKKFLLIDLNLDDLINLNKEPQGFFVEREIKKKDILKSNALNLYCSYNSDGLVPAKNKLISIWPIFLSFRSLKLNHQNFKRYNFMICLYNKKNQEPVPFNVMNFLIVEDLKKFEKGIWIKKFLVKIYLCNIIGDLPATSKIINFASFNAKNSCLYCHCEAKTIEKKNIFPLFINKKRTHEEILNSILNENEGFEHQYAPHFIKLNYFKFDKCILIEAMHNLVLGIGKKMLNLICFKKSPLFVASKIRKKIEEIIKMVKIPIIYKKKISKFNNSQAIEILLTFFYYFKIFDVCGENFSFLIKTFREILIYFFVIGKNENPEKIKDLITKFLIKFKVIMGDSFLVKNIHLLDHEIRNLDSVGCILECNSFKFESFNQIINKSIFTNNNFEAMALRKYNEKTMLEIVLQNDEFLKSLDQSKKKKKGWKIYFANWRSYTCEEKNCSNQKN